MHLKLYPSRIHQHVVFDDGKYIFSPVLLEFIAENPVLQCRMPDKILAVTEVLLDAGLSRESPNEALALVSMGSVARRVGPAGSPL